METQLTVEASAEKPDQAFKKVTELFLREVSSKGLATGNVIKAEAGEIFVKEPEFKYLRPVRLLSDDGRPSMEVLTSVWIFGMKWTIHQCS